MLSHSDLLAGLLKRVERAETEADYSLQITANNLAMIRFFSGIANV